MSSGTEWKKENRERSREIARNSYHKNRDKILAKRRENSEHYTIKNKEWRKANPEKAAVIYRRRNLKQKYDLTIEEWDALAISQNYECAICHSDCSEKGSLVVDHDHDTGAIRGLLCKTCNRGIGLLKDSVNVLLNAANYLARTKIA